jgi:hypothetical protein
VSSTGAWPCQAGSRLGVVVQISRGLRACYP